MYEESTHMKLLPPIFHLMLLLLTVSTILTDMCLHDALLLVYWLHITVVTVLQNVRMIYILTGMWMWILNLY